MVTTSSSLPQVTILTLTWNSREKILGWLSSVEQIDYPRDSVEIVVHDNASTDGSQEAIRLKFGTMRGGGWLNLILAEASRPAIMTEGFNQAFAHVSKTSRYIWRLDNDVVASPDALRTLITTAESTPDAGIVGCKAMYSDRPTVQNSGAVFINWWGGDNRNVDAQNTLECDVVQGCAFLVRKEIPDRLGFLFDPHLGLCTEESDLCMRSHKLGFKVLYEPRAKVYHDAGTTTGRNWWLRRYFFYRNGTIFMRRYNRFPLAQVCHLRELLSAAKLFCATGSWLGLKALKDGLLNTSLDVAWWERKRIDDLGPRR